MVKKRKKQKFSAQTKDFLWYHGALSVELTEHFDFRTKRSHDLFGFADWLAIFPTKCVLVQETSRGNISTRKKKIISSSDSFNWLLIPGHEIWVLGWDKKDDGYRVKKVAIGRSEVDRTSLKPCGQVQAKECYWKEG